MALANIIDQVTIGKAVVSIIDADPSINGFSANAGSVAQFTDANGTVFFYEKTTSSDMGWEQVGANTEIITTTDGNAATILTIPTVTNSCTLFSCSILSRRVGGSNVVGAIGDVASFKNTVVISNVNDTVTILDNVTGLLYKLDVLWGGVSFTVSGTNVLVQVTGKANATINWKNTGSISKVI